MKALKSVKAILALVGLFAIGHSAAAPILQIDPTGVLRGAQNVDVEGVLYDVTFTEGSCKSLFNNCSQSAFTFTTQSSAMAAARALSEQVSTDSEKGWFDSNPYTFGCDQLHACTSLIPFAIPAVDGQYVFESARFSNLYGSPNTFFSGGSLNSVDTTDHGVLNFALFSLASERAINIPEPSSFALLGLALAGLMISRRNSK